jgi:hypothetical protein
MKAAWAILIIVFLFVVIGLTAICTIPDDRYCKKQVIAHNTDGIVTGAAGDIIGTAALQVDNKIFWKVIKIRYTDEVLGYGFFGIVICN